MCFVLDFEAAAVERDRVLYGRQERFALRLGQEKVRRVSPHEIGVLGGSITLRPRMAARADRTEEAGALEQGAEGPLCAVPTGGARDGREAGRVRGVSGIDGVARW